MLLPIAIASVSTIAVLAAVGRAVRVRRIRKQLEQPFKDLPPELGEAWSKNRLWKFASEHSVVGGTAAFTTAQALFHLNRIDGTVLDSIDTIYQPGIENSFPEILSHLHSKSAAGEASFAGAVNKYKGEVGELHIAEYLESAGHHVELAASTNQVGWDAIVDGQLVNFKAGLGMDHIQKHLEDFPNIPVITVAEQAATFSDNTMVTCLGDVSGEEIAQATEDAMSSVVDATDFGLEIPLVTLALSAAKNFKPVIDGHSNLSTAAINTSVDTAGIGIGGMAGAKAGALAGAFGGPVGMVAGSILGGLAGAIGGRSIAKGYKEKALNKYLFEYENRVGKYGYAYIGALEEKAISLESTADHYMRPFSFWRFLVPAPSDLIRADLRATYLKWARRCRGDAYRLVNPSSSNYQSEQPLNSVGAILLKEGPSEPVYHPKVESSLTRIRESVDQIITEKRRLGYMT
tara:strand:+ start:24 stop:1403 length:1380 start_codon:yes stop_codon:yes gene_type:complete